MTSTERDVKKKEYLFHTVYYISKQSC